jgi:hypothetical protein
MNKTFRTMLFATALFPVAAFAQDATTTTTPGQNQDPLVVQPDASATPPADQGTAAGTAESTDPNMQNQDTGTAQSTDPAAPAPDSGTAQTTEPAVEAPDSGTAQTTEPAVEAPDSGTAQTTDPALQTQDTASADMGGETFVTVPPTGAWRVADLVGKDVYGADNEDIGEINDVIVGQDGRVIAVIVGVGGFLGIGEKNVAVGMTALQFGPGMTEAEAQAAADATGMTVTTEADQTGAVGTTAPAQDLNADGQPDAPVATSQDLNADGQPDEVVATEGEVVEIGDDALPDRIVLNVTKEQLEDAPRFEGIRGPNQAQEQQPQQ